MHGHCVHRVGLLTLAMVAALASACAGDADSSGAEPRDGGEAAAPSNDAGPTSDDGGVGGDVLAPGKPTIASWLGTNVAADLPYADIGHLLAPFDTPLASKDANGYPLAGAAGTSSTDIGFVLPSGDYEIAFKGDGTVTASGIASLAGGWTRVGDEQRGTLTITGTPGEFGRFLSLHVENAAAPAAPVHDLRILYPGVDYATTDVFLPEFLRLLAPFRALRFMDWENTNGSTLAKWADRPAATTFGVSPFGQPWERIVELVNLTGKDCWITVPEHADDDFITQLARFLRQTLDFTRIDAARATQGFTTPFRLVLEGSNETWNNGFTAYRTYLDAANADPARYSGDYTGGYGPSWQASSTDLMKVGRYEADRLVTIGAAFHAEFDPIGKGSAIAPVLSGWTLGAAYSDVALRFIADHYGDPKTYVSFVALAPYFDAGEDADGGATSTLDSLFTHLDTNIDALGAAFRDFAKLGKQYGIAIAAYEGGQSLTGTVNQPIKHLAQHDQRMQTAYNRLFALWKKELGDSLFMHFSLAGTPGVPEFVFQYGYWGSIAGVREDPVTCGSALPTLSGAESIASVVHHCPKYRALLDQVAP
jgi:hypothetical protein